MTTALQHTVSSAFEISYRDHAQYPKNLLYRASFRKVLEAYKQRLDQASAGLFLKEATLDRPLDVRFREYDESSQKFEEVNENAIDSLTSLRVHLGDASTATTPRLNKSDPICRYVSVYSDKNRRQLKISRGMFNLLLSFFQVMPSYLDFVSVFGLQLNQRDLRLSGFHEQSTIAIPQAKQPAVAQIGRSGCGYQMSYNLKAVVDTGNVNKSLKWSKLQAAVHHQFDMKTGASLWMCTEGRKVGLFDRIRDLTTDTQRREDWSYSSKEECFRSTLATHLTCCHWSIEEWRSYVSWLEQTVEAETQAAISGIRAREQGTNRKHYSSDDLQLVQSYEDQINEVIMILEANNDIMKSLSGFYDALITNTAFDSVMKTRCKDDVRQFVTQIDDMCYDAGMQIRRAELLVKITADRKALVLQHLQGQATEATLNLTLMSYKEAIIMRIITIVTIVFLPATFVSTFFSTDVVKFQGQDGNGTFSREAMYRWLQVALPLSVITLGVGYIWYRQKTSKSKQKGIYSLLR